MNDPQSERKGSPSPAASHSRAASRGASPAPLLPQYSAAPTGTLKDKEQNDSHPVSTAKGVQDAWWNNVPAWIPIVSWISLSSAVILMNKYILYDLGFSHPIFLTTLHVAFQVIASRALHRFTPYVDGARELEASGKMNREVFLHKVVPIGVLFSVSLILSNWVYLRLSVSFIQMIKAITPVSVLAVSVLFKVKTASAKLYGIVGIISLGVIIASYGEIDFDLLGFTVQIIAILVESCRLVLIQILLQGLGMSPLVSLYYTAPVVLASNSVLLVIFEGLTPFYKLYSIGYGLLFLNASLTFALNLASVWLIGKASGLVLTLSGVIKDILLVVGSWLVLGSTITITQIFGYFVALAGLVAFKTQG
ncbi:uncharacterized protein L969DRAFT_96293 [Mixia osmundae IAM 14324]|uniref:Sugar phosphate transporter domain-containing protein n=1 Tax=Mixia osmundae (strain CBS 9802 / IAM 14324 / JCM 22182 / KY 12970) TaxID=764103 RepID=G7E505_MIXOS|nr:uncharacterized protein L969DRAFT_96293 [Mixia osmundae IAM 14324]KEI37775.1 hypothetical protein L969DRAFT_96293 [Mixia osmundae IAM 14324]GAA97915.1 hypothetical protein E5Q_04595 [Mixia osmundae IAM 14324]